MPDFQGTTDIPEDDIIEWVADNLDVEDVFPTDEIKEFCINHWSADDLYGGDDSEIDAVLETARLNPESIKNFAQEHLSPTDVFDDIELETWAENHGYVLSEKI